MTEEALDKDFYLPAEWEKQEAIWLSWPTSDALWPGILDEVEAVFAEIAAHISRYQEVRINASAEAHAHIQGLLQAAKADMKTVTLFDHPTNDVWCRDHGPLFLRNRTSREILVTDWQFNAWGGKFESYDLDNQVPERIAQALEMKRVVHETILEGGAIESNGKGTFLTTTAVLLNKNRGGHSLKEMDAILKTALNAKRIVWFGSGISHDDTDGHIDNVARFFKEDGVCMVKNTHNPAMRKNWEKAKNAFSDVVPLPMPDLLRFKGRPLPASYANFLVINGAVLYPVFGQKTTDQYAKDAIQTCFPMHKMIPIDCRILLIEGGAIHCLSMQQPSR